MRDFVFSLFKNHKKFLSVTLAFSLILFSSVQYALQSYFDNASREVVENWYANELTNIQQGNVLSSVTKLQRTLHRSALIKGVRVTDIRGRELVSFGKNFDFLFIEKRTMELSEQGLGVFAKAYSFSSSGLDIYILTESRGLLALLMILGLYLVFMTMGFAMFVRTNAVKEQELRAEISMQQLRLESKFNARIASISRSVAHDIRSPLSVLNVIGNKMKTGFPEEGQLLSEVSRRIIQIADGLLEASRIVETREPVPQTVETVDTLFTESAQSIQRVCEQAVAEKKLELGTSLIRIQLYIEVSHDFKVFCDGLVLSRIISNLLNNSIEALKEEGFISLTLSEIEEGLLVEVRDSGPGMSEELISKIYNGPFSEGKARGNGLGLWSSIEQVKSWQGVFQIKGNSGTTISILLKRS